MSVFLLFIIKCFVVTIFASFGLIFTLVIGIPLTFFNIIKKVDSIIEDNNIEEIDAIIENDKE